MVHSGKAREVHTNNACHSNILNEYPYRWDMSVEQEVYNTPPPLGKARTLASLHKCCHFSKPEKHLGSINAPLLDLEPSQYVLDELHILLRVADVLMRNLILLADHLDHKQKHRVGTCGQHVKTLQDMVNACGVSFVISPVGCLLEHMLNTKLHNGLPFTNRPLMRMGKQ